MDGDVTSKERVRRDTATGPQAPKSGGTAAHPLLSLQRNAGNRAVAALVNRSSSGADPLGGTAVPGDLESRIGASTGQPLDGTTLSRMESAFGADFSGVRVHTGAEAGTLSESLQAKAFTTGNDVFFGRGTYDPASSSGQELLAHELTHVVQQTGEASRSVRRFVDTKTFKDRTKQGALTGKSTAQKTIEKLLVKYAALDGPPVPLAQADQAKALLTQMRAAAEEWLAKHGGEKGREKRGAGMAWFLMATDAELDAIKAQSSGTYTAEPEAEGPGPYNNDNVYGNVPAADTNPDGWAITNLADNEPDRVEELFEEEAPYNNDLRAVPDDPYNNVDEAAEQEAEDPYNNGAMTFVPEAPGNAEPPPGNGAVYANALPLVPEQESSEQETVHNDSYGAYQYSDGGARTNQGPGASAQGSKFGGGGNKAPAKYTDLKKVGAHYKHEFDQGSVVLAELYDTFNGTHTRDECKQIMMDSFGWTAADFEKNWDKAKTITDPLVDNADKLAVTKVAPEDQANYELHMNGTITQGPNGDVFDTKESFSKFQGAGWAIFVMSPDGRFYAGSHKVGLFHHSSFLSGGDVAGAGELKVSGGALNALTNKSGHYTPTAEQMIQVFSEIGPSKLSGKKYIHLYGAAGRQKQEYDAGAFYQQFKDDPAAAPH